MLKSKKFKIKKHDPIVPYCDQICSAGKDLYNAMNYYCRQVYFYTGNLKAGKEIKPETEQAYNEITGWIREINEHRNEVNSKGTRKSELRMLDIPGPGKWLLSQGTLDAVAHTKREDVYRELPAKACNQVLFDLARAWLMYSKNLSKAKKERQINPTKSNEKKKKYKPIKYVEYCGRTVYMGGGASIKTDKNGDKYIQFPTVRSWEKNRFYTRYYHKWLNEIPEGWDFRDVGIIPTPHGYYLNLQFKIPDAKPIIESGESKRIIGIDLGLAYFAAIANNFGERPVIINGRPIANTNDFWAYNNSRLGSILTHGKDPNDRSAQRSSKSMRANTNKRNNRVDDYLHKASRWIIDYCIANDVDTIVVGKNKGWKNKINIGRKNNRKFTQIPHSRFIDKLKYKAEEAGIKVIEQPEAYTSKASFLDLDPITDYDPKTQGTYIFSGDRKERGLYIASDGTKVHADVNGALNIIRKAFPDKEVGEAWRSVALLSPIKVNI